MTALTLDRHSIDAPISTRQLGAFILGQGDRYDRAKRALSPFGFSPKFNRSRPTSTPPIILWLVEMRRQEQPTAVAAKATSRANEIPPSTEQLVSEIHHNFTAKPRHCGQICMSNAERRRLNSVGGFQTQWAAERCARNEPTFINTCVI